VSLRARLTLWYTTVLTGGLFFFSTAVYGLLTFSLISQIEANLEKTAADILVASQTDMRTVTPPRIQLTGNVYVQVWGLDEADDLFLITTNLISQESPFDRQQLTGGAQVFSTVFLEEAQLRVLTVPVSISDNDEIVGYLQLASSLDVVERVRSAVIILFLGGGGVTILIAALIGYIGAKRALRPIDRLTETAIQITRADDLSKRIPLLSPPPSEVGQLILAFNETLERLEALFEGQRRFLADVSHELRTPLTVIRGNIDLIRRMDTVDPVSLEVITSETDRMTRLVQDLMLLAQAETGKLPIINEPFELDTLLLEVYQQAKVLAHGEVHVRLGKEDQALIEGDRDRMKQVLLNLVANAIQYTPPGGVITLSMTCEGDEAVLSVADTGQGIAEADLPHIFDRFYRVDRSRRSKEGVGAGLGLSIAYWITRLHRGTITVESKLGEGSEFKVRLPRVMDATRPLNRQS